MVATMDDDLSRLKAELEQTRRKLAESYQLASLGRLVAGVVHEINTPIGSIRSNNEVTLRSIEALAQLLAAAPPSPKVLAIVDTIRSLAEVDRIACDRISAIIRSLKTHTRAGEGDLRKADLNEILRDALKLSATAYKRRIAVETDFGELPTVECYPQLMSQVFLNLLVNAGQAIEGEGKIRVTTQLEAGMAHVAIADSGCGIPAEQRDRIFTPGFTTKPLGVGMGLGLVITREIVVDTHHGSIDFESEPGRGTTFHVRIPVKRPGEHS